MARFRVDIHSEAGNQRDRAERFLARERRYPSRILADKIHRNRKTLRYCRDRGIRLIGPAPGRPRKDEQRDREQNFIDECEPIGIGRRFSLAKRKCGLVSL